MPLNRPHFGDRRRLRCPCCDRVACALFQRLLKQNLPAADFAEQLVKYHPDLCGSCAHDLYGRPGPMCRERNGHVSTV